ncbi:hypothetical protein [Clostridium cylindrosporum]|uniref:Uncharacterized protein n=1 Tax=Clostridium cylindrosporum DSM 605 TaxID=1121307 RepID=A0A0J8G0H1_CLOCY|nr:hypothetical protein [Clostridium cylindrosporum]KMT21291.1 hypothetical protein CLCY_2c00510 [Clostridium cylindrosporum DSM 605]
MKRKKKKGSAVFIVVMLMSVILILSFSLIPLTLTSVKQSNMIYGRNRTYYTGEGTMDKMLHYIDVFSERARISAYRECFTEKGEPNLNNIYVNNIYRGYNPGLDANGDPIKPAFDYEIFKQKLINYYKHEFNIRINAFFNSSKNDVLSLVEGSVTSREPGVKCYTWKEVKDEAEKVGESKIEALQEITDASNEFYRFKPTSQDENYVKEFSNIEYESSNLSKLPKVSNEIISMPSYEDYIYKNLTLRETFYIKSVDDKQTKTYASITIDFDPISRDKAIMKKGNEIKKNDVLNYGVITEDNLIAGSNLTINSDVIVGGEGKEEELDGSNIIEYGGLISGIDDSLFERISNSTPNMSGVGKGNITIKGNAYVGELDSNGNVHGGFIETVNNGSKINILGNSFSHSIITNESSSDGNIEIGKSAFVADNVSVNGQNNSIDIKENLIGFEDGADLTKGYLSSPSIVINNHREEEGFRLSKLSIGKQVALAGEGFVENLIGEDGRLFKTFETTAIYPNYVSYSNYLNTNREFDNYYKAYTYKSESSNEEIIPIDMFDKYRVQEGTIDDEGNSIAPLDDQALFGIRFILSYLVDFESELSNIYDMGKSSLTAENIKIDNKLGDKFLGNMDYHKKAVDSVKNSELDLPETTNIDSVANEVNGEGFLDSDGNRSNGLNISYFNYIMYASGKMFLTRTPEKTLLDSARIAVKKVDSSSDIVTATPEYSVTDNEGAFNSTVFPAIKDTLSKRLNLEDVVKYKTLKDTYDKKEKYYKNFKDKRRLDRCFDWDKVSSDINISNEDVFIKVSKGDIILNGDAINNKKYVFIASEGDVVINTTSNVNINGCIFAKKNLITKGEDITITTNLSIAKEISNYNHKEFQEFLAPSQYLIGEKDTVAGVTRTVKTNIDIINKRQVLD